MSKSTKYLLLLLILYCIVRLLLILSPLENIKDDPGYFATERYRGFIAMGLIAGAKIPIWDYIDSSYTGSALISGAWTVPFFLLFGNSLFALKLAPICWHLLSLTAWYYVFRRHFSHKQTFFILLFLVLTPPQMTKYMLFNIGSHFEMPLWMALSILIFRRFLDGRLNEMKAGIYLGFLGGFSSWDTLTNLVTVGVILIYLGFVKGTKIRKSSFYALYILSFLIGFSPLIVYNWYIGWEVLDFAKGLFLQNGFFLDLPLTIYKAIRHSLRALFYFPNIPTFFRHFFMDGYTFLYLLSLVCLLWKKGGKILHLGNGLDIETFGLLFQVLLFSLFIITKSSGAYYLVPLIPFIGMTIVIAVRTWNRRIQKVLGAFCISAGILGNFSLITFPLLGMTPSLPGYSHVQLVWLLDTKFGRNPPMALDKFKKLLERQSFSVKKMLCQNIPSAWLELKTVGDLQRILSFIHSADLELQPILFEKFGIRLGIYTQFQHEKLESLLQQLDIKPFFYPSIYRGVVQGLGKVEQTFPELMRKGAIFCKKTPIVSKPLCYEGLGLAQGDLSIIEVEQQASILPLLEREYITSYLRGLGEFISYLLWADPKKIESFLILLKTPEKNAFLEGLSQGISEEVDPFNQWKMRQQLAEMFQ